MRTAITLFVTACLLILLVPLVFSHVAKREHDANGNNSRFIKTQLSQYFDTVQVNGQLIEKSWPLGFMDYINVDGGIQLVHDASMGNQVKVVGPAKAVEAFQGSFMSNGQSFKFNKQVFLEKPVQVHLDIDAHNMGIVRLHFNRDREMVRFPSLITKTPLKTKVVRIAGCPIAVDELLFD
ncbi:MAG: hypothetical protein AAFU67_19065, partial [Bacteroidota bacterium]